MKRDHERYKSSLSFTDLLFNLLVGFVFLFIVAFILINPPTKQSDAPRKAEYLIVIEWDPNQHDDVDLWVKDPQGVTVSFTNKEGGLLNLEKDDLGAANDTWINSMGERQVIPINREVVTMRGIVPGRYQVAAHIYSRQRIITTNGPAIDTSPGYIIATLIKINPYGEVYKRTVAYQTRGQVITLFNFELDDNGNLDWVDEDRNNIVLRGGNRP